MVYFNQWLRLTFSKCMFYGILIGVEEKGVICLSLGIAG